MVRICNYCKTERGVYCDLINAEDCAKSGGGFYKDVVTMKVDLSNKGITVFNEMPLEEIEQYLQFANTNQDMLQ